MNQEQKRFPETNPLVGTTVRAEVIGDKWSFHIEDLSKEQYVAVVKHFGIRAVFNFTGPDRLVSND